MSEAIPLRRPPRRLTGEGSAARQVQAVLRQAIITLELLPGARLSEQEIADRYGVSRQPVREALIGLTGAQLVEVQAQRGTVVTRLSMDRMMQARFVREAVEIAVIRRACARFAPASRAKADELLAVQSRVALRGDHGAFQRHDERFHAVLADGAGCVLAWRAIRDVKTHMDRVCSLTLSDAEAMQALVRQHEAILDAVDRRDPDRAEAAMRHHLTEIVRALPDLERLRPELFEPREA